MATETVNKQVTYGSKVVKYGALLVTYGTATIETEEPTPATQHVRRGRRSFALKNRFFRVGLDGIPK